MSGLDLPPLGDRESQDSWRSLDHSQQHSINTAFANLGKAIAAFEQTLNLPASRFDAYLAMLPDSAETDPGTAFGGRETAGLQLFIDSEKTRCLRCHNGPLLTNGEFHNIGTGGFDAVTLDFGRQLGLQAVLLDEFNCPGRYSTAPAEQCWALRFAQRPAHGSLVGAFKTPSLR